MTVAKGGGRRMAAPCLLLSLAAPAHVSDVSTGYLLPALLQVTCMDTWPCYRETKPSPRAHAKASASPSSHPQSCSFARLFCPGTEAERKPQSSFRAPQEPFTSQPQGVRSWAVNKLLFTTQSRARRTVSREMVGGTSALWQDLRFHLTPQCDSWRPQQEPHRA